MQEVIGYELNPKTGLMKAIYKEHGPTPAQWLIVRTNRVYQADWIVPRDKLAEGKHLAKLRRDRKREK